MRSSSQTDYLDKIEEAASCIRQLGTAKIALVLGSGLGPFVDYLKDTKEIDFKNIPHMPTTSVEGHKGKIIFGTVAGKQVFCLAGRTHAYEGYFMHHLTFIARVMKRVGVELYIATNSSGGCQPGMKRGSIMAIRDHMNWFKRNPLYDVPDLNERHVDMRRVYSSRLISVARRTAKEEAVQLFEGTYCGTCGPTYETFTEVEVGSRWGGSAFGMSTIPETMAAYSEGLEVFACSMITNLAAGIDDSSMQLTHEDVTGTAGEFAPQFTKFMLAFIANVTTRPPRPLVTSSSTVHSNAELKLPQPQAFMPTKTELDKAAEVVVQRLGASVLNAVVAIYCTYGTEGLLDYLCEKRSVSMGNVMRIPLCEIPGFPVVSVSGRQGELCVAHLPQGIPILFLRNNGLESFNCEESVFVALLLAQLGVEKLVHTFFGASCNPSVVRADTVRILGDATDFTTISPVPRTTGRAPQYLTTALFNSNSGDLGELKLAFRFAGEETTSKPLSYAHVLGPSFPTRSESNLALNCGIDLVGITSLGLVYASRSLGLDVVGIAGVTYEIGEDPLSDASYVLWKKVRTVVVNLIKGNFVPKRLAAPQMRPLGLTDWAVAPKTRQVTYHLANPVTQGEPSEIAESVGWLQDRNVALDADLAIVIDSRLPCIDLDGQVVVAGPFPFAQIPKFPEGVVGGGSLTSLSLAGKTIIRVHGTCLFNEGRTNSEISFGVRVLQKLRVKRVLFINEVVSYLRELPVDSLVLLRDHFNLSGRNPLFGHNKEEFGIRFIDMGNLYTDTLRQMLRRSAQQRDIRLAEVTCAFVMGPIFASAADAAVVKATSSQVATTGMIPEVIVARHAQIPLAAVGVVKSVVLPGESASLSAKFKKSNRLAINALIHDLIVKFR